MLRKNTLKRGKPLKRTAMKTKGRKQPSAAQQLRHDKVREMGCVICGRPAAIHHIREGLGMGQKVDHKKILPLCYDHHQSEEKGCISLHGTPALFVATYGTELELEAKLKNGNMPQRGEW
jgi:hypothetical protein